MFLAAAGCAVESGEREPTARATFALTNTDVTGFESVSGWSTTTGTLSSSSQHVQGSYSLAVSNVGGNAQLTSAPLTTLSSVSDTFSFSLQLPTSQPNPYWYGNVQVSLNAPSRGLYSAFIGQRDLTGLALGAFNELSFTLPPTVVSALGSGTYSDLTVTLTLNFPSTAALTTLATMELAQRIAWQHFRQTTCAG